MGNSESVSFQKRLSRFRPEERPVIDGVLDKLLGGEVGAGKGAEVLTLKMLKLFLNDLVTASMAARIYDGMRSVDPTGKTAPPSGGVSKEQVLIFLSDMLRGTAEEKGPLVQAMISRAGSGPVKGGQVKEFTEDLLSTVMQIVKHKKLLEGWSLERTRDSAEGVKLLATQMTSELKVAGVQLPVNELLEADCDQRSIEDWLFRVSSLSVFLGLVLSEGLGVHLSQGPVRRLLPQCRNVRWSEFQSILDLPCLMYLNSQLPSAMQDQWRFLFSTRLHGESFSQLCGQVVRKGPTVLVLRDNRGHVFGGFASQSWEIKPKFQGNNQCFLFSLCPSLSVYTDTGYNDHYMYLNQGQQTMPNGLGMGGQHYYFGLWLDSDFGKGHSRAKPCCSTYSSPQLSAEEEFILDCLEVWAVGEPPEELPSKTKRSVLDSDVEIQAMMEMTGKSRHSEGLREPLEEEED
ncbi:MTOR-associated protein MEAK7 isoform X2 [Amia ocellicauda]